MSPELLQFAPIGVLLLMAIGFAGVSLLLPRIAGKRRAVTATKDSPYECGMPAEVGTQGTFGVKFYLVAMLFILFDLEVVFVLGWATTFQELVQPVASHGIGEAAFWVMLAFIGMLEVGHLYVWKRGALNWGNRSALRQPPQKALQKTLATSSNPPMEQS